MPITDIDNLNETVALMLSESHEDRFKAEYHQLKYRYLRLRKVIEDYDDLNFTPKSPKEVLLEQAAYMQRYMIHLEYRAELEGIKL